MAKDKKSFILYSDARETFEQLTNEEAGVLIKHIFAYVNDENPILEDRFINLAFQPIKTQLKRDLVNWEIVREKRSQAGKKSAEAKQQILTKSTSVESVQQNPTKSTVNVNVNDNVIVNGIEYSQKDIKNLLNKFLLSEIKISDGDEFLIFGDFKTKINEKELMYFKTAVSFQKLFIKNLREKDSVTIIQENAKFSNYVTPIRLMFEADKVTTDQISQAYEYLGSIQGEFWKSNILSTSKLREKIQVLIANKNTATSKSSKKSI